MKHTLIIMSILSTIFGTLTPQNSAIKLLSTEEFRNQVKGKNVQLVDVRTAREYKSGHLDHAVNIDFYSGKFNTEFIKLDKENAIYVYCRSGSRSRQTANKLAAMGFTEIYDLEGGILKYY